MKATQPPLYFSGGRHCYGGDTGGVPVLCPPPWKAAFANPGLHLGSISRGDPPQKQIQVWEGGTRGTPGPQAH